MSTTAISIQGLTKTFGRKTAVNQASFTVESGDVFGLLGPNGAGKTTIIRMLVGLIKPTSGTAQVFGFDPQTQRRDVLIRSATILESPALYPKLNGYDNLRAMGFASGVDNPAKVMEVLELIGLRDRAKDKFDSYSLGMKQRLCIAASLLTDPELIILDEPTNGLDPAGMRDIRELIRNLAANGHTVLLSSHLLNEVQQVCNRVAILQFGQVIASGSVNELLAQKIAVRVKVAPDEVEKTQATFEILGYSVSVEGATVLVSGDQVDGREINTTLAQQGIYAAEISIERESLEDYYLTLTESGEEK